MELRHLRYFVVAAEECHFTRAAKRLNMAQPPLSQQIQQLETELGFRLFHRLARGVALTEAGEHFFVSSRALLERLDAATKDAREIAQGKSGTIRIGFTSSAAFNAFIPGTISAYRRLYPGVATTLHEATSTALLQSLRSGDLDAAFIRLAKDEGQDLPFDLLINEEMQLAVPVGHPFAQRQSVSMRDLTNERFVVFPKTNGRSLFEAIFNACHDAGFSPRIAQEAPQMASSISLVAAGVGVAFVPLSMCHLHVGTVRYLAIEENAPRANLYLATRSLPLPSQVSKFVTLAKQEFRRK